MFFSGLEERLLEEPILHRRLTADFFGIYLRALLTAPWEASEAVHDEVFQRMIRLKLIHALAKQPCSTYSTLKKQISSSFPKSVNSLLSSGDCIERSLNAVAEKRTGLDGETTFVLKQECVVEYDRLYPYLSIKEHIEARELLSGPVQHYWTVCLKQRGEDIKTSGSVAGMADEDVLRKLTNRICFQPPTPPPCGAVLFQKLHQLVPEALLRYMVKDIFVGAEWSDHACYCSLHWLTIVANAVSAAAGMDEEDPAPSEAVLTMEELIAKLRSAPGEEGVTVDFIGQVLMELCQWEEALTSPLPLEVGGSCKQISQWLCLLFAKYDGDLASAICRRVREAACCDSADVATDSSLQTQEAALKMLKDRQAAFLAEWMDSEEEEEGEGEAEEGMSVDGTSPVPTKSGDVCVLCHEGASPTDSLGMIGLVAASPMRTAHYSLKGRCSGREAECPADALKLLPKVSTTVWDPALRTCGHFLHAKCLTSHLGTSRHAVRELITNSSAGEFLCPLCQGLANCLVPGSLSKTETVAVEDATAFEETGSSVHVFLSALQERTGFSLDDNEETADGKDTREFADVVGTIVASNGDTGLTAFGGRHDLSRLSLLSRSVVAQCLSTPFDIAAGTDAADFLKQHTPSSAAKSCLKAVESLLCTLSDPDASFLLGALRALLSDGVALEGDATATDEGKMLKALFSFSSAAAPCLLLCDLSLLAPVALLATRPQHSLACARLLGVVAIAQAIIAVQLEELCKQDSTKAAMECVESSVLEMWHVLVAEFQMDDLKALEEEGESADDVLGVLERVAALLKTKIDFSPRTVAAICLRVARVWQVLLHVLCWKGLLPTPVSTPQTPPETPLSPYRGAAKAFSLYAAVLGLPVDELSIGDGGWATSMAPWYATAAATLGFAAEPFSPESVVAAGFPLLLSSTWRLPRIIPMPESFDTLLSRFVGFECPRISNNLVPNVGSASSHAPPLPAMCLRCGEVLCSGCRYCKLGGVGECHRHAGTCGGGTGGFLMLTQCWVLIIHGKFSAGVPAPYVDKFGEGDKMLRRGVRLTLSRQRFENLNSLVLDPAEIACRVARLRNTSEKVYRSNFF